MRVRLHFNRGDSSYNLISTEGRARLSLMSPCCPWKRISQLHDTSELPLSLGPVDSNHTYHLEYKHSLPCLFEVAVPSPIIIITISICLLVNQTHCYSSMTKNQGVQSSPAPQGRHKFTLSGSFVSRASKFLPITRVSVVLSFSLASIGLVSDSSWNIPVPPILLLRDHVLNIKYNPGVLASRHLTATWQS